MNNNLPDFDKAVSVVATLDPSVMRPLGGVAFTGLETGILAGFTGALNFGISGLAFEGGVGIGSLIGAAFDTCREVCQ